MEPKTTGLVPTNAQDVTRPLAWMTPELLAWTREIWMAVYGHPVTDEEAVEILTNVKRFTEIIQLQADDVNERSAA